MRTTEKPGTDVVAKKIEAILTAKDPATGDYRWSKKEVRDFIVACIFQLGLPVVPELQNACMQFIGDLELSPDATDEQIVEHVVAYFEEHPLPPQLLAEFQALGQEALFGDRVQNLAGAEKVRHLLVKGASTTTRAPVQEKTAAPAVKARRGLSRAAPTP